MNPRVGLPKWLKWENETLHVWEEPGKLSFLPFSNEPSNLINDQIINSQGRDFFKCKGGVRRISFTGLSWTQVLIVIDDIQTSICFIWILFRLWELEDRELKIFLVFVLPLGKFWSWFHVLRFGFGFGFLRSDWAFNKLLLVKMFYFTLIEMSTTTLSKEDFIFQETQQLCKY